MPGGKVVVVRTGTYTRLLWSESQSLRPHELD